MGEGVLTEGRRAGGPVAMPAYRDALFEDAGLERVGGELVFGGVRLSEVAAAHGTPAYVYSFPTLRRRFGLLTAALDGVPHRICFSVKCNGNLAVLRLLHELGAGADIVSGGELARALRAGMPAAHVVFSGVGKREAELVRAVEAGVGFINVESVAELELLADVAARLGRPATVGIRVNPEVQAETHPYISTGKRGDKFGVPLDVVGEAAELVNRAPQLTLGALAMHIGSQIVDVAPFAAAVERVIALRDALPGRARETTRALDIGGGLGIRYRDEAPADLAAWRAAVVPLLRASGCFVLLEPGRFIAGPAGVLLTRVEYLKQSGGTRYVIVDAGKNDLVRPSYYRAWHEIVPVRAAVEGAAETPASVVGPVCETGDFLALDRDTPPVARGDLLAVLCAGAYGFSMASTYNARPRPPEVAVDGGAHRLIRRRETVDELLQCEEGLES